MRETNIDLLERAVNTIAFGDIEAEDTCNFSERNFLKLFRLSQLMVRTISAQEASSCVAHKEDNRHLHESRRLSKEQKLQLQALNKDIRKQKKQLRTYEIIMKLKAGDGTPTANLNPTVRTPRAGNKLPRAYSCGWNQSEGGRLTVESRRFLNRATS
eukprot:1189953-Prorocentrum_minimum.AAC.6